MSVKTATGRIVRFGAKGYGWIRVDDETGSEIFFHQSAVVTAGPDGKPITPYPNDRCSFLIFEGEKGPAARNVRLLDLSGDANANPPS